jgi:hypothetical protein
MLGLLKVRGGVSQLRSLPLQLLRTTRFERILFLNTVPSSCHPGFLLHLA